MVVNFDNHQKYRVPENKLSRYALKIENSAKKHDLVFEAYSYQKILETISDDTEFITRCVEVTGTKYEEQLKFALASDASFDGEHVAHAGIGIVPYGYNIDFKHVADALISNKYYNNVRKGKFSTRKADISKLKPKSICPGHLGINRNMFFPTKIMDDPSWGEAKTHIAIPYVFDNKIKDLTHICFPTGYGAADELVAVSAEKKLSETNFDEFLKDVLGTSRYFFADIGKLVDV